MVYLITCSWIKFSFTVIWVMMTRTDGIHDPDLVKQAEKVLVRYNQQYENNILFYCILNGELNIISLYWNKQQFESSIIKWGCCLLDKNFHLILMFTCFGSMQICIGWMLSRLVYTLAQLTGPAFEADICTWWKGILVQWFSELLFHLFLCNLAIDIVVMIVVIDLSHQIVELGKDRDDGYYKMLIGNLERWGDKNLFLPSLSQRTSFPVAIEAGNCSKQNKTFHRRTDHQWPVCTLR